MRRVLTAAEMREVDRLTVEQAGIPSMLLMETAAASVVRELETEFAPLTSHRVVVLCGKGANGGDGLAIARQLFVRGLAGELDVALFAAGDDLTGDSAANRQMALGVGLDVREVTDSDGWTAFRQRAQRATLIVDALLGTGLNGPARGLIGDVIEDLAADFRHVKFAAVDIPSGMASDSEPHEGPICPANLTVTFTAPKVAQTVAPGCRKLGRLVVAPIGTPDRLIEGIPGLGLHLLDASDAKPFCLPRPADSHKGSFGHVGVVAGSRDKPGAAILAGAAAARSGAGLTTVITTRSASTAIVSAAPALMTVPLEEAPDGSMSEAAAARADLNPYSVLVLGPGLGVSDESVRLMLDLISSAEQPVVVDADALTALSRADAWPSANGLRVLTPHPGEMARLTGMSVDDIQANRIEVARNLATSRDAFVVLKGERTLIACPNGRVLINPTGGPGLATGGSGDVLAGLLGGLLAQFPDDDPAQVIAAAVYLHGLAGDLVAESLGEQGMIATDILEFLPQAFLAVRRS